MLRIIEMKKFIIILFTLIASGCSTTMPINYVASPVIKGQGNITLGEFTYIPAEKGLVKPNEFQKSSSAIGTIYMSDKANDLLRTSLLKELVAAGFEVLDNSDIQISGMIKKFKYDWLGFTEVDFYLDVEYSVTKNNVVVYENTIKTHKASPKAVGNTDSEAVKSVISSNIGELFQNLRAKKIL